MYMYLPTISAAEISWQLSSDANAVETDMEERYKHIVGRRLTSGVREGIDSSGSRDHCTLCGLPHLSER